MSHEFKKKHFVESFLLLSGAEEPERNYKLTNKFHVALQGHFMGKLVISLTVVDLREKE